MDELNQRLFNDTPIKLSKHMERLKAPQVDINIKKKKLSLIENSLNLVNFSSFNNKVKLSHSPLYTTPKIQLKKLKRPDGLSFDFHLDSLKLKSRSPNQDLTAKSKKNIKNLNLFKFGDFEKEDFIEKLQNSKFPVSFKVKKGKKVPNSISSTMALDKIIIPSVEPAKLERILMGSNTPTPEVKVPKYIRHESFKAGYFLNKIDKVLNSIRVNRSKASLRQYDQKKIELLY